MQRLCSLSRVPILHNTAGIGTTDAADQSAVASLTFCIDALDLFLDSTTAKSAMIESRN